MDKNVNQHLDAIQDELCILRLECQPDSGRRLRKQSTYLLSTLPLVHPNRAFALNPNLFLSYENIVHLRTNFKNQVRSSATKTDVSGGYTTVI